ncbi:NADPH:quinone oxidoreductase, partial [Streptomyces sp. SID7982]|nr:NADPH:quinone oxidoreductase [Streptomyces sp. SID7982]
DQALVARKPEGLSHTEAAGLALVGVTAWEALVERAGVQAGERVLVHGGAGGVGSAAIQVAHALGAEVVTTARA